MQLHIFHVNNYNKVVCFRDHIWSREDSFSVVGGGRSEASTPGDPTNLVNFTKYKKTVGGGACRAGESETSEARSSGSPTHDCNLYICDTFVFEIFFCFYYIPSVVR